MVLPGEKSQMVPGCRVRAINLLKVGEISSNEYRRLRRSGPRAWCHGSQMQTVFGKTGVQSHRWAKKD